MAPLPAPAEFVVDRPYPQAVVRGRVALKKPLAPFRRLLWDAQGLLWAIGKGGIGICQAEPEPRWLVALPAAHPLYSGWAQGEEVWLTGEEGVSRARWDGQNLLWEHVLPTPEPTLDLAPAEGGFLLLGPRHVFQWTEDGLHRVAELPPFKRGTVLRVHPSTGDLWVGSDRGLGCWREGRWEWFTYAGSGLPSNSIRDLQVDGEGFLWIATAGGTVLFDGREGWYRLGREVEVPYGDTTCIALGPEGSAWLGTPRGLARLWNGRWDWYASRRWLPQDEVQALVSDGEDGVWVATPDGLVHLDFLWMTLEEKALRFEEACARHHLREGWVASRVFERPGETEPFLLEASDNDGLWTALYLAAESFRYAVTGSPEAKANLSRALKALAFLEEVTPIPGFPARAARRVQGERSLPSGGEWHPSEDGQWEWKGDTSSDEVDGHFFGYAVCYDVAADEEQRALIREKVGRIMDHIIENDFVLQDVDGERTQWGVWRPDLLNRHEHWRYQRGLNSLEILSHLKTAHHIVGEERYEEVYHRLAFEEHYALNLVEQYNTHPEVGVYHDNQLAFLAYFNLLRYEEEPSLRRLYLLSLERTWRHVRRDRAAPWNFIYGLLTGRPCDVAEAVETLRDVPLERIRWDVDNSFRWDVPHDPLRPGRALVALRPSQRDVMNWDGDPYRLTGGAGGRVESDGTFFLWPYWMARYYGLLRQE